jgi:hypothetical protein
MIHANDWAKSGAKTNVESRCNKECMGSDTVAQTAHTEHASKE